MKKFFNKLVWIEEREWFGFTERNIRINPIFGIIFACIMGVFISWVAFF